VCEELDRKYVGSDINPEMIQYIGNNLDQMFGTDRSFIEQCDSAGFLVGGLGRLPQFAVNSHAPLGRGRKTVTLIKGR